MPLYPPAPVSHPFIVERHYQYKLGKAPFAHDPKADQSFPTLAEANHYMNTADSGFSGDTRYRYYLKDSPPNKLR